MLGEGFSVQLCSCKVHLQTLASSGFFSPPDRAYCPRSHRKQANLQQSARSARLLAVAAQQLWCRRIQLLQVSLCSGPCQVLHLHNRLAGELRDALLCFG